jgi:hypothetical protein
MRLGKFSPEWGITSQTAPSGSFIPRSRSLPIVERARTPFKPWVEDRLLNANCSDSQRIDAIPDRVSGRSGSGLQHDSSSLQLAWEARRRHTLCSVPIDPNWDMYNLYLRGVEDIHISRHSWHSRLRSQPGSSLTCTRIMISILVRFCPAPD